MKPVDIGRTVSLYSSMWRMQNTWSQLNCYSSMKCLCPCVIVFYGFQCELCCHVLALAVGGSTLTCMAAEFGFVLPNS